MAKYYDIDTSVRINGGLTVNGDTTIPSSFNLYMGGGNLTVTGNITSTSNISGNHTGTGSSLIVNGTTVNGGQNPISNGWAYTHENKVGSLGHIPSGGSSTTFLRGDNTWVTPTDTNTWRPIDTSPVNGDTANSIASSWAYTHVNTYGLGSHVPTGGSNITFLRGDGIWATPSDTYVTGLSSTAGGNGTLTVTRNTGGNLTLNLAHNHDTVYLGISGTAVNANLLDNIDSSQFLRSDQNDIMGGILTISGTGATPLVLQRNGTPNVNLQFVHSSGSGYLGIDGTGQLMFGASADLNGTGYKVWHSNIFDPTSKTDNTTFITHTGNIGVGSHIPTGGTTSQFLRGDGAWATVATSDTYVTGLSSTAGGNGTLTVSRNNGQSNLTLDLSHNHDSIYLGINGTAVSANNAGNADKLDGIDSSGFGQIFSLASGSNLNSQVVSGFYRINSSPTNGPSGTSVDWSQMIVARGSDTIMQIVAPYSTSQMFFRAGNPTDVGGAGSWKPWAKIWNDQNDGTGSGLDADTIDSIQGTSLVRNDVANQAVGSGFTMSGNAYVGGSTSNGALYVRTGSGSLGIQLAGDNATKQSGVGSYINASGTATFSGTMTANAIAVTSTSLVTNLNAQMLNGIKEPQIAKNNSIVELCGKGVYIGTQVQAQSVPNMTVQLTSGTVYTDTGMRVMFSAGGSYAFASPSATYNRIDSVYVQGSSAGSNEGNITVLQGTASASPVAPSIPSDGILLANVTIRQNAGSILSSDITDMRVWRPMNTVGTNIYMVGTMYVDGALDGITTIKVNKPIRNTPSNNSVTIVSGNSSYTWTHNLNLTNYVVRLSCNSPEPHIYWSNKTSNAITINLDDTYDSDIIIDISLEAF